METIASPAGDDKGEVRPEDGRDAGCGEVGPHESADTNDQADVITAPTATGHDTVIGAEVSPRVAGILAASSRLRDLCNSHGSPGITVDNKPIAKTPAGYDFAYALNLARANVTDPSELATALYHRGAKDARDTSIEHITRVVKDVLDSLTPKPPEEALDFTFDGLSVYGHEDSIYVLTIDGKSVEVSGDTLLSARKMRIKLMDALHRVPTLPEPEDWESIVAGWMEKAQLVVLPPEATRAGQLREQVARVVGDHIPGRRRGDLDRGRSLAVDKLGTVFKTILVDRGLRREQVQASTKQICKALRELGFEFRTPTIDGTKTRVWTTVSPRARALVAGDAIDDGGDDSHDSNGNHDGSPSGERGPEHEEHVP